MVNKEELSERKKKTQLKKLEKAFNQHDKMLIGWLIQKLGDPEAARDIAQDSYLRLWRYAQRTEIENPQALLFKTAANLAANEFRARRRFRANHAETGHDSENQHLENLASESPTPEAAVSARSDVEISLSALKALPEKVQRAFILSRFEDLSYREIAKAMDVSISSVEKYIITALSALRDAVHDTKNDTQKVVPFKINKK